MEFRTALQRVLPIALLAAMACARVGGLSPVQTGSTLPVPDMNRVRFTEATGIREVVVIGSDGAVPAASTVRVRNGSGSLPVEGTATQAGSFVVAVPDAGLGDTLLVSIAGAGGEGEAEPLDLAHDGTPPPPPVAEAVEVEAGIAGVTGRFEGTGHLFVEVANLETGLVAGGETSAAEDGGGQLFELRVAASVGQRLVVHGIDMAQGGASGPFVTVEVRPEPETSEPPAAPLGERLVFSLSGEAGQVALVGLPGAVGPALLVRAVNGTGGHSAEAQASEAGSFALLLTAASGDVLQVVASREGVDSAPAEVALHPEPEPPFAPMAEATRSEGEGVRVAGHVPEAAGVHLVRAANLVSGEVAEGETVAGELGRQQFELAVQAAVGDRIVVFAAGADRPSVNGPFAVVEVP